MTMRTWTHYEVIDTNGPLPFVLDVHYNDGMVDHYSFASPNGRKELIYGLREQRAKDAEIRRQARELFALRARRLQGR